jgi:hypothetical protein
MPKTSQKRSTRRYGKKASEKVERSMHEMKQGAALRPLGQEGHEPQASHCDRSQRSPPRRR